MADRSASQVPRIPPGTRGVKDPPMSPMKTASWPKAAGPKGPRMNKVGFKEIQAYAAQDLNDDAGMRVSKKISKLRHEGEPEKKSVAMALSMERAGRLTESGGYRRVKK